MVETLWPLPLLLSVSVEAGWRLGRLTEVADGDGADGSVDGADGCLGGDLWLGRLTGRSNRADGADNADGGGDALAAAVAAVCVSGCRLAELTVVEMLWPLPLLSVSVEAGWRS